MTYDTLLFLDKNRDFLIPEQFIILGDSEEEFVKALFAQSAAEYKESGGSMKFASVGTAFKCLNDFVVCCFFWNNVCD